MNNPTVGGSHMGLISNKCTNKDSRRDKMHQFDFLGVRYYFTAMLKTVGPHKEYQLFSGNIYIISIYCIVLLQYTKLLLIIN